MLSILLIVVGAALLYVGGEVLVRSVTRLAAALNTSPLVIGLTVVAFGTSSPEVAVVVGAGLRDRPAIALGNVLGSNIANIALILGIAILLRPIVTEGSFLRRDLPLMVSASVLLLPVAYFFGLGRVVGLVLLVVMAVYMMVLFRAGEAPPPEDRLEAGSHRKEGLKAGFGSLAGLGLLIYGAEVLVAAAVDLALGFGISERIVGLTVVAFGTSLPELAGCLVATFRRQGDIVLGNVIGSNIFNTLLVLPIAVLIRPITVSRGDLIDIGVMIVFSVAIALFLLRRRRLGRTEGALLVVSYVVYVGSLFTGAV